MPRGAKKGERRGGRDSQSMNRETVIKAEMAVQIAEEARARGRKLAKDVMDDFMQLFAGMAAYYQPSPGPNPKAQNPNADVDKFDQYAGMAVDCAKQLAKYQSPTFRAVMIAPPPQHRPGFDADGKPLARKFTLRVFNGDVRPPGEEKAPIDVTPNRAPAKRAQA